MKAEKNEKQAGHRGTWRFRYLPAGPNWTRAKSFYWPHDERPPTVGEAVELLQFADLERLRD